MNVLDYHFVKVFDFLHLDHFSALAKLPRTSWIVFFCCLNSQALTVLSYVAGDSTYFSWQNKPQTFLFKLDFFFFCPVCKARDRKRRKDKRRKRHDGWEGKEGMKKKRKKVRGLMTIILAEHDRDVRNVSYVLPPSASLSSSSSPSPFTYSHLILLSVLIWII